MASREPLQGHEFVESGEHDCFLATTAEIPIFNKMKLQYLFLYCFQNLEPIEIFVVENN